LRLLCIRPNGPLRVDDRRAGEWRGARTNASAAHEDVSFRSAGRRRWFRNLGPTEAWNEGQTALDTSLQLQISLHNFDEGGPKAKDPLGAGSDSADEPKDTP